MPLNPGQKLGPYEILAPIAAGGMGEVFRARDPRLDREVAIKVLPDNLCGDSARRERFEREAKTLSGLNHANICAIYDIGEYGGSHYLVMELLQGETLAQRLQRGPLPTQQVLQYAVEIADALDAAHHHGIVHRDLKPGNVVLTRTGAKLLDFGLAKAAAFAQSASAEMPTLAPTSHPLTAEGTVVGTFQYMAPEQLEGKDADPRSDIFAFGAVLHEMATGQAAFKGTSQASIFAAILTSDPPPVSSLQPARPAALDRVVRNCLAKDPEARYHSAHDLKLQLQWVAEAGGSSSSSVAAIPARSRTKTQLTLAFAVVASIAAFAFAFGFFQRTPRTNEAMHLQLALPGVAQQIAISPDGKKLAYIAEDEESGRNVLWVNTVGTRKFQRLEGTDGAANPFWSPDSQTLGFFAEAKLKKVPASGGTVQVLANAQNARGASWSKNNTIIFTPAPTGGIFQISAEGGTLQPLLDSAGMSLPTIQSYRFPQFLPDGEHFLFLAADFSNIQSPNNKICIGKLGSKDFQIIMQAASNVVYADGRLLFVRDRTLVAQNFDAASRKLSGEAVPVADAIYFSPQLYWGAFSVSETGTLMYQTNATMQPSQFTWMDRSGRILGIFGTPRHMANPAISPDGRMVAFDSADPVSLNNDIYVGNFSTGVVFRLTFDPGEDANPAWSPDGSRIALRAARNNANVCIKAATALANEDCFAFDLAVDDPNPSSWSKDGKTIMVSNQGTRSSVDVAWFDPSQPKKVLTKWLSTTLDEFAPQLSPDGRWVAYVSNESGKFEVYVSSIDGGSGKFQVSSGGGLEPLWSHNGKELYFLDQRNTLMAVPVTASPNFTAGAPQPLFRTRSRAHISGTDIYTYDVAPDGRFLVNRNIKPDNIPPVEVVLNWPALVGVKK